MAVDQCEKGVRYQDPKELLKQEARPEKLDHEMTGDNALPTGEDPYGLGRFVEAQNRVYPTVLSELRAGAKRSHWIWFVFPQLRGLGHSAVARRFGISSLEEARAYLGHPVLGPRLRECAGLLLANEGRSASEILGYPDDLKVCSSMTLFDLAGGGPVFRAVLDTFYAGHADSATVKLLG